MIEEVIQAYPAAYAGIKDATEHNGFSMPSEVLTCSLLCTLAVSKPGGNFLEIGTGTGLSTAWILEGMNADSALISIDNDAQVQQIANNFLGSDNRLQFVCTDGADWITANANLKFDYIFADSWPGKYLLLNETLNMLANGGLYIIDDMLPQPNWPAGHSDKANQLMIELDKRTDITLTKLNWASGIIIVVKK